MVLAWSILKGNIKGAANLFHCLQFPVGSNAIGSESNHATLTAVKHRSRIAVRINQRIYQRGATTMCTFRHEMEWIELSKFLIVSIAHQDMITIGRLIFYILYPMLFIIFVTPRTKLALYADDTAMLANLMLPHSNLS